MQPQRPCLSVVHSILATIALSLGVFVLPSLAHAALNSPSTIINGAQYGQYSLGWFNNSAAPARPNESQYTRRVLYLAPEVGSRIIFVAYVNNDATACSATVCHLEFKVSKDDGVTWDRAIDSAKQWLDIDNTTAPSYEYSLFADTANNVWVNYKGNDGTGEVVIRKLPWNSSTKLWSIGATSYEHKIDNPNLGNTQNTSPCCTGPEKPVLALYVQPTGTSNERVWSVSKYWGGSFNYFRVAYTDDFTNSLPSWYEAKDISSPLGLGHSEIFTTGGSSSHNITFIPIGKNKAPGIIVLAYWKHAVLSGVCADSIDHNNYGLELYTMSDATNADSWSSAPLKLVDPQPYEWQSNTTDCSPTGATAFSNGNFPMNFSVAALPINTNTSRVVVAYQGGYSTVMGYALADANRNTVYVRSCEVNYSTHTTTACTSATRIGASAQVPSVGFMDTTAYVAMRDMSDAVPKDLVIYKETSVGTPYTWAQELAAPNVSSSVFSPSLPENTLAGLTLNSVLPPVVWEENTSPTPLNSLRFTANSGGNVFGWGWSSNFGWLSMNCASITGSSCPNPYGVSIAPAPKNPPSPADASFSPSSSTTYPLSGFGWSTNAGFLSFRRSDSVRFLDNGNDNRFGNPPGQAYANSNIVADPTAMYDKSTQKLNGWGRFLNLCSYDISSKNCQEPKGGWLRFQGYWSSGVVQTTSTAIVSKNAITIPITNGTAFPVGTVQNPQIAVIDQEYFYYTNNPGASNSFTTSSVIQITHPANSIVKAISGNDGTGKPNGGEYGVNAYYSGGKYLLSGWAWSNEYGWVRFNPLIFIGFAWMETLYGNIYVNGSIPSSEPGYVKLPDAMTLENTRLNKCGADTTGDGIGDEPCYVSTYRIEANGAIQGLVFGATNQSNSGASSAVGYLQGLIATDNKCGFGGTGTSCAAGTGGITDPNAFLRGSAGSKFGFPSVTPSSNTYRNALGKLDVGGLTTSVVKPMPKFDDIVTGKEIDTGVNRFGNTLYVAANNNWTVGELAGQYNQGNCNSLPTCPPLGWVWPLAALQNQVVHVQGDLTVGQGATSSVTTFTSIDRIFETLTVAAGGTANFPTTGTLIIETGEITEEYVSYTGISGNNFTGVKTISGVKAHTVGATVRWVWRWLYTEAATKPQNLTIVVDGDLKINYNIIASDRAVDLDLVNKAMPSSIKDAHAVAFIVKGNVKIAKEVNKITGAYIVTSRDTSSPSDYVLTNGDIQNVSCGSYAGCGGVFMTGNDNDPAFCSGTDTACNPLKIEGLLFARLFAFQRVGDREKIDVPAEQVTFDQRLFLNPPPGLEDVTKALPNPTRTLP